MMLYGLGAWLQWNYSLGAYSFLPYDPFWLASVFAVLLGWPLACEAAIAATFLTRRRPRLAAALLFLAAGVLIVPILVTALVVRILVPALATGVLIFLTLVPGLVAATAGVLAFTSIEPDATAERWTGRAVMRTLAMGIASYVLLAPAFGFSLFATLLLLLSGAGDFFLQRPSPSLATVAAFDAMSGQELWRVEVAVTSVQVIKAVGDRLVVDGSVQGLSACAILPRELILDWRTGKELSRTDNRPEYVDRNKHGDFEIALKGYPGSPPDLYVDNDVTGAHWHVPAMVVQRWTYEIPFAVSDGRAYAFARTDELTAYDAQTGTVMWRTGAAIGYLAAGDGYAFVASNGKATALDSNGAIRWSVPLPGDPPGDPSSHLTEASHRVYAAIDGRFAHSSHCGD